MKFLKKKSVIISVSLLALVVVFVIVQSTRPDVPEFSSQVAQRIDLAQTVSETGSVEAELELLYGWEGSGKVVDIYKQVGDSVTTSEQIARLANAQQQAKLKEALAALSSAQAKLNLELAGPSDEATKKSLASVAQSEASLKQSEANLEKVRAQGDASLLAAEATLKDAENDLQLAEAGEDSALVQDAYADLINILKSSVTSLGSALTESDNILGIDNIFANDEFEAVLDQNTEAVAHQSYFLAKARKQAAEQAALSLSSASDHVSVDAAATTVQDALVQMQEHLLHVQQTLAATNSIGDLSQSELDALKSGINTEQDTIDTSSTNVTNGIQAIATARNSLIAFEIAYDKAVDDLAQTKKQVAADIVVAEAQVAAQQANLAQAKASYDDLIAPPRAVDVASLRADVARQAASVDAARDDVSKTELLALAGGVISRLDIEVGENVTANQEVIGILSEDVTIEVDISESDIAKVALDDTVRITLDAYGDDVVFEGYVLSIEPAETEISGVVYYKTTIIFNGIADQYDIRSGMTANVDILTDVREAALVVPRRAILTKDGVSVVRVVRDPTRGVFEERTITTGLIGDDGVVEVLSGLAEGEEIVTFLKEE